MPIPDPEETHLSTAGLRGRGCESSVADTLDQWVAEGNQIRKNQLVRCSSRLRCLNKHHHALQVWNGCGRRGPSLHKWI